MKHLRTIVIETVVATISATVASVIVVQLMS